jgi:amino acid adenylation domain-containing protein
MLVSLLAIWKAGCAYVPLDPSYPEKRLDYILEDTGASVLISQSNLAEKWADRQCRLVYLDDERDQLAQESNANLPLKSFTPDNLAYVIHTSGSTGEPKGVRISRRNVTNFLLAMQQQPGLGRDNILLAVTTLSFDISVLELFLPLISGAMVVLAGRDVAADGRLLASLLEESQATVMQATPATWIMLLDSGWGGRPTLKVLCGGEAMPLDLPERLLPRAAELWNMYGPTETTVWSSVYRVKSVVDQISIGRPIANTTMCVLDETMQPVPAGIHGELYIGGLGVSSGYLNKPELTASRFVDDPFSDKANAILFKTGDSARYLLDGNIVILGRLDQQVKYHGSRIELAEIEHALNSHTSVARSVAAVLDDEDGSKRIVIYYIPADGEKHPDNILRDHLSSMLPAYMVPSRFVALEEFPLTPNLKIDRSALPRPDRIRPNLQTFIVPPSNETEMKLAGIWCDLLQIDNVA